MEAFVSGAWRTIRRAEVTVGGAPRTLSRIEIYKDGAWRTAARFTSPLTVTANDVVGTANGRGRPTLVVSSLSQATPTGGLGPYSYSWSIVSGSVSISSPLTASTVFSKTVAAFATDESVARVTCTDALGTSAFRDINISLFNESNQ